MTVRILDRGCGTGKTSQLLEGLTEDAHYLIVVPTLGECQRVIDDAPVAFAQPSNETNDTKTEDLAELAKAKANIVCTHSLFVRLAELVKRGLLDDYTIIIDEVLDVCHQKSFRRVQHEDVKLIYIPHGLVDVCPETQLVTPTRRWEELAEQQNTYEYEFYQYAKSGCLYYVKNSFFLFAIPSELLKAGLSVTILTFLAEGSVLMAYLEKLGIPYEHDVCETGLQKFKADMRKNLTVRSINNIDDSQRFKYTFGWQSTSHSKAEQRALKPRWETVGRALKNLYERKLKPAGVSKDDVMLTCAKEQWYSTGEGLKPQMTEDERRAQSRRNKPGPMSKDTGLMNGVYWTPNTTRGTNDYIDCSVAIYLYNQHLSPAVLHWLGIEDRSEFEDSYAITELIQWLFRTRIRRGEPVTLYLPSKRMRDILERFLHSESNVVELRRAA